MRRLRIVLLVLLAALSGCELLTSEPQGRDAVIWAPTPVDSNEPGYLHAIAAISPDDIWAVGGTADNPSKAQAIHWDGIHWTQVDIPSTKPGRHTLSGVAALAKDDIWAVGEYEDSSRATYALIAHSDGKSWEVVAGPDLASHSHLSAVVAVSANDVWAVGAEDEKPLIMHWDGKDWSIVPGPVLAERGWLSGIAAVSAQDIWAVGTTGKKTLTLHWNGADWHTVPSPSLAEDHPLALASGGMWSSLGGVAAITSNDVWAVGLATDNWPGSRLPLDIPLAMHWDGNAWTMSTLPSDEISEGPRSDRLSGVAAVSANDVWAVGGGRRRLLVMHWDGKAWSSNPCPTKGLSGAGHDGWLESVAVRSDMEPLAVGTIWERDWPNYDTFVGSILRPATGPCPTPTPMPTEKPWPTPVPMEIPRPTIDPNTAPTPVQTPPDPVQTYVQVSVPTPSRVVPAVPLP